MNFIQYVVILFSLCFMSCRNTPHDSLGQTSSCNCDSTTDTSGYKLVRGALLGSRFKTLDELKSVVQIEYFNSNTVTDSTVHSDSKVSITHCSNGKKIISVLASGISQGDFRKAKDGTFWDKISMLIHSPYAVRNRKDLEKAFMLSRRMTELFGEGDPAFYDLAQAIFKNINTPDLAFINPRDSTEKGYINTFNHMTAQAFITSIYSEELADFIGDSHERYFHPELITGKFPKKEILDLGEGPVDNYVDLINNEWGQELGKELKEKYHITASTIWSPEFLSGYLNAIQSYYSWALQIGFKPFTTQDEIVIRFSNKLNLVLMRKVFSDCK